MAQNNGFTLWLTGMACSGKTTLASYIAARLRQVGRNVEVLDENELGETMWGDTQETKEERIVAVKRLGFMANLLSRNQVATVVASVSPYKAGREENRKANTRYLEVYVDCPTETLISRDSTGRYKKALSGEIPNFIGITEPYEPPNSPEVTIHSDQEPVEEGALKIFQALLDLGYLTSEDLKTITGKKMKANPVKTRRGAKPAKADKGSKARPAARAARVAKPTKPARKR
jgi:adenylylsulfate kinase